LGAKIEKLKTFVSKSSFQPTCGQNLSALKKNISWAKVC